MSASLLWFTWLWITIDAFRVSQQKILNSADQRVGNQLEDVVPDWSSCGGVFYRSAPPNVALDVNLDQRLICHRCPNAREKSWSLPNCRGGSGSVCERFRDMCDHSASYDASGACKSKACPECPSCAKFHWSVPSYHTLKKKFHHPSNEFLAVDFDESRGIARWLAYRINSFLFPKGGAVQRTPSFYNDPNLGKAGLGAGNYSNQPEAPTLTRGSSDEKPYVKGHILMNREFAWGAAPELASNFYSNIAPQLKIANHPAWYHGCEDQLLRKISDPENKGYEFYIIGGASGSLDHPSGKSAMTPNTYPRRGWGRDNKLRDAIPAFWWKTFIKVDRAGKVHESGGWIGENSHTSRTSEGDIEVFALASLPLFEKALRKRCGGCKVDIFPGIDKKDHASTPAVTPLKPLYDCETQNKCGQCVTASDGGTCKWCPWAFGAGGKCVNRHAGRLNNCFMHTGWVSSIKDSEDCDSESGSTDSAVALNSSLPKLDIHCSSLKAVAACGKSGATTAAKCESQCRGHGVGWFDFSDYRCVWVNGVCKNGAHLDGKPTECADTCGVRKHLTATEIARMSSADLAAACVERHLPSDGFKKDKIARLRVRECVDILTNAAIAKMKKADLVDACLARGLDASGYNEARRARLHAFDGNGLRCFGSVA